MTDKEMIESLKENLKEVLCKKHYFQERVRALEEEVRKLENTNESLHRGMNKLNKVIGSIYNILGIAGFRQPED
jgi:peptidoglycan hydrolase CwlO-like protein